jgi:hypothetical protein
MGAGGWYKIFRRGMENTSQDSGHWSADPAAKPGLIWKAMTGKNNLFLGQV